MKAKKLDQTRSQAWKVRAEKRVPVMSQTFSKAPMCFPQGSYPAFLKSGQGCRVTDVDGNEYIDFILGLGPTVLGYAHPVVDAAIRAQLADGISFSLPHTLETEVAELLAEVVPCAEMSRFSKTGSEATSAAVRAARTYTKRDKIAYASYHGWHDWYAVATTRDAGIPRFNKELVVPWTYNDAASLHAAFAAHPNEIAAVILEPVTLDEPNPGFLEEVVAAAHKNGALVIFDEIVSGFRIATGGGQAKYGVTPDLATFGKGMANGMPLSAVCGKADVMKMFEEAFFSTTFGGETLSLAAAKATIGEFQKHDVSSHLWSMGEMLKSAFEGAGRAAGVDVKAWGPGPHFVMVVKDQSGTQTPEVKSLFLQECVRRGLLLHFGAINLCHAHTPVEIQVAEQAMGEALQVVAQGIREGSVRQMLDGAPYGEVFKRNL